MHEARLRTAAGSPGRRLLPGWGGRVGADAAVDALQASRGATPASGERATVTASFATAGPAARPARSASAASGDAGSGGRLPMRAVRAASNLEATAGALAGRRWCELGLRRGGKEMEQSVAQVGGAALPSASVCGCRARGEELSSP